MKEQLELSYQVFMEADDISQTRILKTVSFLKNLFKNCQNIYLKDVEIEDESDLDDFSLRLFAEKKLTEEDCTNQEDAASFVPDMMEFLDALAQAQSYADMEGKFRVFFRGEEISYEFSSQAGMDFCEFLKR